MVFLIAFFTFALNVNCGTLTTEYESLTVVVGATVTFTWNFTSAEKEEFGGFTISNGTYVNRNPSNRLWQNNAPRIFPKTKEVFGDRFQVNDNVPGKILVTIKNMNYKDSMNLSVRIVFVKGLKGMQVLSNIEVQVQAKPALCEKDFARNYSFAYQSNPSIDLCISGNQRPKIEYTFDRKATKVTDIKTIVDSYTHYFKFTIKLPQIKASHCGKELAFKVSQGNKEMNRTAKIFLLEKGFPLGVIIKSFFRKDNILTVRWNAVESGKCVIKYFLKIAHANSIEDYGPIEKTTLRVPEMKDPVQAAIFAQYDSKQGPVSSFAFIKRATEEAVVTKNCYTLIYVVISAVIGFSTAVCICLLIFCILWRKVFQKQTGKAKSSNKFSNETTERLTNPSEQQEPRSYVELNQLGSDKPIYQDLHLYETPNQKRRKKNEHYEIMETTNELAL